MVGILETFGKGNGVEDEEHTEEPYSEAYTVVSVPAPSESVLANRVGRPSPTWKRESWCPVSLRKKWRKTSWENSERRRKL